MAQYAEHLICIKLGTATICAGDKFADKYYVSYQTLSTDSHTDAIDSD
jgi:hypothetical protein